MITYDEFLTTLSKPARGAFLYEGINSFEKLITYTEAEILAIHGVGPKTLPTLYAALEQNGLTLKGAVGQISK